MAKENLNSKKIIQGIKKNKENMRKFSVKKIGLFGSFAKEKQNKKSDVDIVVDFENPSFDNYMDLLFLLEKTFKRKVDLVIEKDLHSGLSYIKNETKYIQI